MYPIIFKVKTPGSHALKEHLREQMNFFHIKEKIGGINKRCWVKIGDALPQDFIDKHTEQLKDDKNWMEFIGFSRIDGDPVFKINEENLGSDKSLFEIIEHDGIRTISGDRQTKSIITKVELNKVERLEDNIQAFMAPHKIKWETENKISEDSWDEIFDESKIKWYG